jgi:protein-disulfide isomerase
MIVTLVLALFLSGVGAGRLEAQTKAAQSKSAQSKTPSTPAAAGPTTVLPSEDTVNSFLFQWLGYDPSKTWKVAEIRPSEVPGLAEVQVVISDANGESQTRFLVSSDGKHALVGEILPFGAKPFEDAHLKLEKGVNGPSKGPANAAVTIVEFSDMQCPHCQKAAPAVNELLSLEPEARFVFQNFPLPMHDWAEKAAGYVDCVGRASAGKTAGKTNEAVWKFIDKTFEDQANITLANADEKLKAIATASGVNGDEIAACAVTPETKARIEASIQLGKAVGVTGTPTIFVNGRNVSSYPVEVQKKVVDFQASQEKKDK